MQRFLISQTDRRTPRGCRVCDRSSLTRTHCRCALVVLSLPERMISIASFGRVVRMTEPPAQDIVAFDLQRSNAWLPTEGRIDTTT
jgi:hypothetical protein